MSERGTNFLVSFAIALLLANGYCIAGCLFGPCATAATTDTPPCHHKNNSGAPTCSHPSLAAIANTPAPYAEHEGVQIALIDFTTGPAPVHSTRIILSDFRPPPIPDFTGVTTLRI